LTCYVRNYSTERWFILQKSSNHHCSCFILDDHSQRIQYTHNIVGMRP